MRLCMSSLMLSPKNALTVNRSNINQFQIFFLNTSTFNQKMIGMNRGMQFIQGNWEGGIEGGGREEEEGYWKRG